MKYLTAFLLLGLPLVVLPFGVSYFEVPKVLLAEGLIDILLIWTIFRKDFSLRIYNKQLLALIFLVFIISLIHLVFLPTPTTLFGNPFRLQGIFLLWHLMIWSIISSKVSLKEIPDRLFGVSLLILLAGTLLLGNNESGRAIGTLGEPNFLAATAVFLWPLVWFKAGQLAVPARIACLLSVGIIIFLTGSKSGLLALSLQLLLLALWRIKLLSVGKTVVVGLSLLALTLALPILEGGQTYEDRSEIWLTALAAGFEKPILGSGFGNIEQAIKQTSVTLRNNIQYQYIDSSHNLILDWWVQAGFLGLVILGLLLFDAFKGFVRQGRQLELVCLLGLLTTMLFNPVSVVNLIAFWWLIGRGFFARDDKITGKN